MFTTKKQLCSKGGIDVVGENATSANETSCGSFQERQEGSVTNSFTNGCGCEKIQIDCKAHNCTYNDNCKCTASSIQVDGSNAHESFRHKMRYLSSAIVEPEADFLQRNFSNRFQSKRDMSSKGMSLLLLSRHKCARAC